MVYRVSGFRVLGIPGRSSHEKGMPTCLVVAGGVGGGEAEEDEVEMKELGEEGEEE